MPSDLRPLVVDLDGTLVRSDSLIELVFFALRQNPLNLLRVLMAGFRGRPQLKAFVGQFAAEIVPGLPANADVSKLIRRARESRRPVYLATASGQQVAREVARVFGPFDGVISSNGTVNLKGLNKARVLKERFGKRGFDYVGNSAADISIFECADHAFLVGGGPLLRRRAAIANTSLTHFPAHKSGRRLFQLTRPHQWAKNLLLFVPAVGAQAFEFEVFGALMVGFVAFGAIASGLYVFNDLLDVAYDRTHPVKRFRPLAQGDVSAPVASVVSLGLILIGILLAFVLSRSFLIALLGYSLLSLIYSLVLKRFALVDVFALASLYVSRLVGGAVIAGVALSPWLMSFSFFVFLSLALAKRYVELSDDSLGTGKKARGRGYVPSDLTLVGGLGLSVGVVSAMLLALYVEDRAGVTSGSSLSILWSVVPLWLYWVLRTWFKAFRSELDDDPVLYALRDRVSLAVGVVLVMIFVLAS